MSLSGPTEFDPRITQVQAIRDKAVADKASVTALYPRVSSERDARITAFSKLINVFNSVQLSFTFISKHLLDEQWWSETSRSPIPDCDKQMYLDEFESFIKIGFVQCVFSAAESSLRILLRALDPAACDRGTAEFKSIYECLFNSKLAAPPTNGTQLLDLLRPIRTTIHNNGVYSPRSGGNITTQWQGQTFEFKQGTAVDFVTWDFLIRVSDSLRALLRQVMEDANLRNITVEIGDPFSHR